MKLNYFESALQCKFKIRVLTCFYSPGLVPHSPKSKERVRVQKVGPGEVSPSLPGTAQLFYLGKSSVDRHEKKERMHISSTNSSIEHLT